MATLELDRHTYPRCSWLGCEKRPYGQNALCGVHLGNANDNSGHGRQGNLTAEDRAEIVRRVRRFENPLANKSMGITRSHISRVMRQARSAS